MKNLLLSITLLLAFTASTVKAQLNPKFTSRLQYVLDSTCNLYHIKGASAAVLVPNVGLWKGVYGISDIGKPITPDMLFGIASNTKTYVSSIMLKLQEMGKLSINDTLGKWFQHVPNVNGKITIKQILNHTSGLFDYTQNPHFNDSIVADFHRIWKPEEMLPFIMVPDFKPGTSWEYSNTNYLLAGLIIKQVMNKPFEKTLRDFILVPQGLNNTIFFPQETSSAPVATPWSVVVSPNHAQETLYNFPNFSLNSLFSLSSTAGAMMQTAEDNVNFWHALHAGEIINQSSLKQMLTGVYLGTGPNGGSMFYGLGIFKYYDFYGKHTILEHGGSDVGYTNENAVDTVTGICFSLLSNQDSVNNDTLLNDVIGAMQKATTEMKLAGTESVFNSTYDVQIYPNPAKDILTFNIENLTGISEISIYNMTGKEVLQSNLESGKSTINIDQLPSGLYVVQLVNKNDPTIFSQKIQISK